MILFCFSVIFLLFSQKCHQSTNRLALRVLFLISKHLFRQIFCSLILFIIIVSLTSMEVDREKSNVFMNCR
jgi:hypothetical protein